jgi:nitrogen fixation/metabolism regulation signal transduction histidine kinase
VVALVAATGLVPILSSIVVVEYALSAGEHVVKQPEAQIQNALDKAIEAYRELFAARKEQFRAEAIAIAATWNGHIDDPAPRHIRRWKVEPAGPSGNALGAFPPDKWRPFVVRQPLGDGRTLELEFVADWERFNEFENLGKLPTAPQMERIEEQAHRAYHWYFVAMFAAIMLPLISVGVLMGRRTTRRLTALAGAAREVGAGNLGVAVQASGQDEIAQLGRAFNEMVSELAQNRAAIAYLEKIGAWQEVARRLAHEIKNPLTPIQLAMQQLHSKFSGDDAKFRKLLDDANEIVNEEIGTLRRLVDDFSAFARLPRVMPAPLDLGEVVADVARGQPGWEGKVRPGALQEPLMIKADKQLLRRVIINLIENSLQAGATRVEVRAERHPSMAGFAQLAVEDDGPGVPSEASTRIFEPYFTTKEHGTGLGLAIVKKIALEHGGDVDLERPAAGGARFVLRLPLG